MTNCFFQKEGNEESKKDIDNSASPKVRTNEKLKKKTNTKGKGIEGDVLKNENLGKLKNKKKWKNEQKMEKGLQRAVRCLFFTIAVYS